MKTEEEQLREEAQDLVEDFETLPLYRNYQELKKAVANDQRLAELRRAAQDKRRGIGKTDDVQRQLKLIAEARALEEEYQSDPRVSNLANLKEELERIADRLTDMLN